MAQYVLTLTFANDENEKSNLDIDNVKKDITQEEISALMDTIINNKVFYNSKGLYTKKVKASVTQRTVTAYDFTEQEN